MQESRDIIPISEGKKLPPEKPIDLMPMIKFIGYPLTLVALMAAHTALFFTGANRDKESLKEPVVKSGLGKILDEGQRSKDTRDR